ncbi:uncharacterized protein CANTADRAFT_91042 [Suhomyces tanzawaensis NRRL Y-17324]|uniref:DNA-directed RNA polymerase III subunit RPC9 n=1 Tax=Suhomyces tanzawaensis NRRL Y-17324 TaxID=984487 RepID=A0A1E4SGW9_9ASCO|nr:uncharacterized protein CANTADRAFT_91042 [Suhomyces tanzawaensis NRRL Y-17324]ODV78751.1 hypothetical protein CANTADRAFT_91042 [Suhomyces tanzawaensis NRRL Y-17324]
MKILNERDSFLSNYEVGEFMKDIKKKYNWTFTAEDDEAQANDKRKFKKRFTACGLELEVITRDVLSYLSNSASSAIDTQQNFQKLMEFLNGFELMKIEKLQIVNALPRSMVHLYALVEECDLRFDEERCELIIAKINELFPVEEEEEEEEQEEQDEGEESEQFKSAEQTPEQ